MRNKKKEAKFFCESCGSEVPRNSRTCPQCGKFFAAVRCPKCGKTGTNEDFANGCPSCGYALNPDGSSNRSGYNIFLNNNRFNLNNSKKQKLDLSIFSNKNKSSYSPDSGLPIWIYVVTVLILIFLVIYLYSCL